MDNVDNFISQNIRAERMEDGGWQMEEQKRVRRDNPTPALPACRKSCGDAALHQHYARMNWFKRDKEPERFYLLPGQGGRALRRKHRMMLQWSLIVGLLVSAALAWAMCSMNNSHP